MTSELLTQIFQVCIIPLLGVLTTFIIKWINVKSNQIQKNNDNALANKYIQMLTDTINSCVIATNQTYVESLKKQGKFDAEAQKQAFEQTTQAVLTILSQEAKDYLANIYGDLDKYISEKIEASVNIKKKKKNGEHSIIECSPYFYLTILLPSFTN